MPSMLSRVAGGLLLASLLMVLGGIIAFPYGSSPASWDELTEGARWYLQAQLSQPGLLLGLLGTATLSGLLWVVMAARGRARFRSRMARPGSRRQATLELRLGHAQRRLQRELTRARHNPAAALDAVLGLLVDLEGRELRLEPGEMTVTSSLLVGDRLVPLAGMAPAQYQRLLAQADLVSGASTEQEGEIELRSPGRADRIRVRHLPGPAGPLLSFQLIDGGEAEPGGPPRRRSSTLLRMEAPAPSERRRTGELSGASWVGPEENTNSASGLLTGIDPSAESEIAPLVKLGERRPVGVLEGGLGLLAAAALLGAAGTFMGTAHGWALQRLRTGQATAPWLELDLIVRSRPPGARVEVGGEVRGTTPLRLREPCRRRPLQVIVARPGHAVWQWGGICPASKQLELQADLRRLPRKWR